MRPWPDRRARVLATACASLALVACSVLVNRADSQCASDTDCARFAGTACVQGGCVVPSSVIDAGPPLPDSAASEPCATTDDCLRRHDGANWICRHTDGVCVSLVSTDCPAVIGDYTSDDVLLLGALLPLYGPHLSTGAALGNALRLAVGDFAQAAPPSAVRRPIAVVLCNESNDVHRAAQHLLGELLVPAIIGTGESASTVSVVSEDTLPAGALLMSPRATANLASYEGRGLVWRTCPSDSLEAAALVAVTQQVLVPAAQAGHPSDPVRVALVYATDVESTEIDAKIAQSLVLGGLPAGDPGNAGRFIHIPYGNPDDPADVDPTAGYRSAATAVTNIDALPDVIILVGATQATEVLAMIERSWPEAGARRAQYVLSAGAQTTELLALAASSESLRARILGTAPGGNGANVAAFRDHYRATFAADTAPEVFGAAQAYDALYTLAFAASVAPASGLAGGDLTRALRLALAPRDGAAPTPVTVGSAGIPGALAALTGGAALALDGASAPLAFNTVTGEVVTDVQVWCMMHTSGAPPVFRNTGLSYVAQTGALAGTASCGP